MFTRRHVASLLLVGVVLSAGCVGATPGAGTETPTPESDVTTKPFPDHPDALTAESAGPYAAAFEEAYRHNVIRSTADNVTSISVGCEAASVTEREDGYTVTARCGFSWMFGTDGRAEGVADGRPYEATYVVTPGLIERVGSTLV